MSLYSIAHPGVEVTMPFMEPWVNGGTCVCENVTVPFCVPDPVQAFKFPLDKLSVKMVVIS
jgi:hypothetical protein